MENSNTAMIVDGVEKKPERFSLERALNVGWEKCWKYFWAYAGICTSTFLLSSGPQFFSSAITWINTSTTAIIIGLLLGLFGTIMTQVVAVGFINLQLRVLDGKPIVTRDVFSVSNKTLNYAGAAILNTLMVAAGTICFIVPGIIFHIKFQFYGYFIVEHNMGPIEALKASSRIAEGSKMDLFLFGLVQWLIASVGTACLMVGGFPAWIINTIATADVYRQLCANTPGMALVDNSVSLPASPLPNVDAAVPDGYLPPNPIEGKIDLSASPEPWRQPRNEDFEQRS